LVSEEQVIEAIRLIYDPEIDVNVYDLGLIYKIDIQEDNSIKIDMTLTSANCPYAQELPVDIKEEVELVEGVKDVSINIVWFPPWGPEQMTEAAKLELGII
jgi:FeS assembly SUF system protein